jgi:hypothetical protein
MAIVFDTAATPANGLSDTVSIPRGGTVDDLIVLVIAIDSISSAGPWVVPNTGSLPSSYIGPSTGWKRCAVQGPSASGTGFEVWAAISATVVGTSFAQLTTTFGWNSIQALYKNVYAPSNSINDGAVRAATSAQVTGDDPSAPSVYAYVDEVVVVCMAETLTGSPSAPTGYTLRTSHARTAQAAIADATVSIEGNTGPIPFVGSASPSGSKGVTATLAIRETAPSSSSPLIVVEYAADPNPPQTL